MGNETVETNYVNEMREGKTQLGLGHFSSDRFYCNSKTKELFFIKTIDVRDMYEVFKVSCCRVELPQPIFICVYCNVIHFLHAYIGLKCNIVWQLPVWGTFK